MNASEIKKAEPFTIELIPTTGIKVASLLLARLGTILSSRITQFPPPIHLFAITYATIHLSQDLSQCLILLLCYLFAVKVSLCNPD